MQDALKFLAIKTNKLDPTLAHELNYIINQIDKYPLLSSAQQKELLRQYHEEKSEAAKEKLINHNLRLVINILTKYQYKGVPIGDLFQEGIFGLMRAIDKFDFTKNTNLSTYATIWISQSIRRAIIDRGTLVRIPVHTQERRTSITVARFKLSEVLGRDPTLEEIAQYTGIDIEKVKKQIEINKVDINKMASLDTPITADGNCLMDILKTDDSTEDGISRQFLRKRLNEELDKFDDTYRIALKLRFGFFDGKPKTQPEICSLLSALASKNISRQRVHQILSTGMAKLKKIFEDTNPEDCL